MNIIILTCLNLDLINIYDFVQQFLPDSQVRENKNTQTNIPFTLNSKPTPGGRRIGVPSRTGGASPPLSVPRDWAKDPVSTVYLIDHLGANKDPSIEVEPELHSNTKIIRYNINASINAFIDGLNQKIDDTYTNTKQYNMTTANLYNEYLTYLQRTTAINRQLIENIFYRKPELIQFLQTYLYGIIQLIGILDENIKLADANANANAKTRIITCDPIFHLLLGELKHIRPRAYDLFYEQFQSRLEIYMPPAGFPILNTEILPGSKQHVFTIPYIQIMKSTVTPEIIVSMQPTNDIHNLDLLIDSKLKPDKFIGQINGVTSINDIITGLQKIFEPIIIKQLRAPRQHIPLDTPAIEIIINPCYIPTPKPIYVIADLAQHLDPDICTRHKELIKRTLIMQKDDIVNLALEWELRIQRYIKIAISIKLQTE
jgi:hypothetical protein